MITPGALKTIARRCLLESCILVARLLTTLLRPFSGKHYSSIIYKVDRIGDWVLSLPSLRLAVQAAKTRGPALLLVSQVTKELAEAENLGCDIAALSLNNEGPADVLRNTLRLGWLASRCKHHSLISLRHQIRPLREAALRIIAPEKASLSNLQMASNVETYSWLQPAMPGLAPDAREDFIPREIARHRKVLFDFVGHCPPCEELLPRMDSGPTLRDGLLVFCPFGSSQIREYPTGRWAQLLAGLCARHHINRLVLPVPPSGELQSRAKALLAALPLPAVVQAEVVVCKDTPAFADLIRSASCVACIESAAAHLAAAYDRAALILQGGGHYGEFGPWQRSSRQVWMTNHLPCFGCDWRCSRPSVECILEIPPQLPEQTVGSDVTPPSLQS